MNSIKGLLVDIFGRTIYPACIEWNNGIITQIHKCDDVPEQYIMPGFVDAHVHIESSMLIPSEFGRMAIPHGTIATVSDPHEIANVLGIKGIEFMIENAKQTALKICYGAPSCVPATEFETAGAKLGPQEIDQLLQKSEIGYLSEMMNYPGVLMNNPEIMAKIQSAKKYGKPVDGHAPGLRGQDAKNYAAAGISTDHECISLPEALEKIELGMKILIRQGSAARNFQELHPLLRLYPEHCMFCSDDKHPDSLLEGHINQLVQNSVQLGYDLFDILRCASLNPVEHYTLRMGLLRIGDPADFIITKSLQDFSFPDVYIDGKLCAENGNCFHEYTPVVADDYSLCNCEQIRPDQLLVPARGSLLQVIELCAGQIVTGAGVYPALIQDGLAMADTARDILKMVVVNRYHQSAPAIGFIKGLGLKQGALASSIAHDSHNIIAIGCDDHSIAQAINSIIQNKGGIAVASAHDIKVLPLDIAGLMSSAPGTHIAQTYIELDSLARTLGCAVPAPFMALSFMALLVIPELKLSDKGLFDGRQFTFTDIFYPADSTLKT
jgi:adenine deaminase